LVFALLFGTNIVKHTWNCPCLRRPSTGIIQQAIPKSTGIRRFPFNNSTANLTFAWRSNYLCGFA
jgi:hypothetical protein